jgi:hypothetical protein
MLAHAALRERAAVPDDQLAVDACRCCQGQVAAEAGSLHRVFVACVPQ